MTHDPPYPPSPLDLRRAVLSHLMRTGAPVRLATLVAALRPDFGPYADAKRVSDVLRYQARLGRARRVARGTYQYVPGSVPRTTAWRCHNWRQERARAYAPLDRPA